MILPPLAMALLAGLGLGCAGGGIGAAFAAPEVADAIYRGGPILTIDDAHPSAEAVAVKDGRILAVGRERDVMARRGEDTRVIELAGRSLLPGFVDSHGHAHAIGLQAMSANLLPPPDGEGTSIDALVGILGRWAAVHPERVERIGWIFGFGYDDSQLVDGRHPRRDDLDRVSTEVPVLVIHQSGHMGSVNSRALALAGVGAGTEDPDGGVFGRRAGSREPDGFAQETAFYRLVGALGARFDDAINDAMVLAGTERLASYGYTTGQEGRAGAASLAALRRVAAAGALAIDVVAYPDILQVEEIEPSLQYTDGFRVGGAKLTIDGSPQGKTAWLTEPYYVPPAGRGADYAGYGAVTVEQAEQAVEKAFARGWQLLCHANGDRAIDVFIEAVRKARARHPEVENRPVLIHGQTLREDQVAELDALDIFPSLFPMHTFYWGDWHRESVLGPERAENISPTGWLMARGMRFGSHHDAPVALPDSMRVLSATVTRRTRSGDILGPEHRVPVATALKALTLWPAWQHFEEDRKGSIEVGKLADLVILSDNPLTVPAEAIVGIEVVETIKEGRTIYRRAD